MLLLETLVAISKYNSKIIHYFSFLNLLVRIYKKEEVLKKQVQNK